MSPFIPIIVLVLVLLFMAISLLPAFFDNDKDCETLVQRRE